ncbi:FAD-dependent oxidoreductase [Stenotrophomonas rhizophila]|uniref:FAD-dependent oxidoreductase n=1 Tax=Stenotrophomonas rhizophila TaxID=216778 RepID=UPI001E33924A|nr:NAD(P)/FAD-dependent oxidoreductase [Stenotrophomonas rhizophila]MCC7632741.1 FAD-dependent monooxygenase [Stenotrophomonas rhizophila]MCC7662534.1 FAD-dependent monooxygenase [Stenotrophomonas rhizophila]
MASRRTIAIVGYGTAGQALSVLLSRDHHQVHVFERAAAPGPVGAGFLLQPSGLDVLWQMDLLPQVLQHGAAVRRLYGETPCGRAVMDIRYDGLDARLHGVGMQRGALFSVLAQAWEQPGNLQADTSIVEVDTAGGRLRDAQGRWHGPYDLVIAADGAGSQLRAQVQGTALDREYPWGALWCLLPGGDWPHPAELRQRYVAARKMIGLLPVGTRPGDAVPRLSFFWSLPRDQFAQWERDGMARWLEEIAALWPQAHQRLDGVQHSAQLARAGYRDAVMTHWHRERLVLVGDAAHAMSPQLGQGVNMALMDALALRDALRAHAGHGAALQAYQAQRRAHVAIYQFWSRWLTPLFQSERDTLARARDVLFGPMGRVPGGRGHMLRVLTGTQRGWLGKLPLSPGLVQALADRTAAPGIS